MIYLTIAIDEAEFNRRMEQAVEEGDLSEGGLWRPRDMGHSIIRDFGAAVTPLERR